MAEAPETRKQLIAYVASQDLGKVSSLLPSNKKRSVIVHSLISAMGILKPEYSKTRRIQVVNPKRATYKDLAIYHSKDYLDFVLNPQNSVAQNMNAYSEFGLEDDCPPFPGLPDYVELVAGASLTAADALRHNITDIAICWDGGRHHAQKSHASGFCYVADCILAIMTLKRPVTIPAKVSRSPHARKPRVMYLDLDLHFSDAVSEAFHSLSTSSIPQILTLSVHHMAPGFFPVSPRAQLSTVTSPSFDPFTLSVPLKQGASNRTYARIWPIIERVKDVFSPDYIVIQCGVDALAGDPCATFNWSLGDGVGSLGWCIHQIISQWSGKKLLLGGGGYNSSNAARAWAYITSIALDNPLNLEAEIPDHAGFPLYAPSFTLDVPAGNMHDHNSHEYLTSIEDSFEEVIPTIRARVDT